MTENENEEILKELEIAYKAGEIDDRVYKDLKKRYLKRLEESRTNQSENPMNMNFKAMGSHRVSQDTLTISGAARLPGGVVPKKLRVSGACRIFDDIEINGLNCSGLARCAGSVMSHGDVNVSGAFKAGGNISVHGKVNISGSAKVDGNVESTDFINISGFFRATGSVNASGGIKVGGRGKIKENLFSDSYVEIKGMVKVVGNVEANSVKFTTSNEVLYLFRKLWRSHIFGDIIGMDEVNIDNIHVEGNVRGRVVKIGNNSKIDGKVEYIDDLILSADVVLSSQPVQISPQNLSIRAKTPLESTIPKKKMPISNGIIPSFCPNCGQEVGKEKKFCPACGSKI